MEFNHGDLTGANILVNRGQLYIIDWERSRFLYSRCFGLGYMLLHFEFFLEHKNSLIRLTAKHSGRSIKSLERDTYMSMKGIKVNDVIWAAQAYSELHNNNQRGWKKYRLMTIKRMREFEEMFEK
jgi:thiamine kinase-like enzyme